MQLNKRKVMMVSTPLVIVAIVMCGVPSNAIMNRAFSEQTGPHGYVVVSVLRGGNEVYHWEDHNLITNGGKDFIAQQIGATSGLGTNGANYIALTNDATAPAATDTTLASEIATNGLTRAQGAYAHTAGTNTFTITKTFTATATQSAQKAGLFTASSVGTMLAETAFTSVTLNNGDTLTITWTITLN